MPTANRDRFVPNAIRYFLRQTYPNRELLILDDGDINIADLVPASEQIRHVRLPSRYPIGAERNLACEMAQGEIIGHWDDDAWLADWRLAYQVDVLRKNQSAGVSGLSKLYFSEPSAGRAWLYSHPGHQCTWVAGGTVCYCKSLWRRFSFADFADAEDTAFIASVPEESIVNLLNNRFYVATVHAGNTSRKVTGDPGWQTIPPTTIRTRISEDRTTRLRRTPTALPSVRGRVTEAPAAQAPHG